MLAAQCGDEDGVDAGPLPGLLDGGGVVVNRFGHKTTGDAVVQDDVADPHQVWEPLLVCREDRDHHEEVEVRLDPALH
jgi:hypothetical protein